MNNLYVLVDKNLGQIINHIQELPEDWKNISGLKYLPQEKIEDLAWAGHPNLAWIKVKSDDISNYTYSDEWLEFSKANAKSIVAAKRWEKQTEYIDFYGNLIKGDERTVSALLSKKIEATENPSATFNWKFFNSFVNLTSAQMIELYNFVSSYIQGCYDAENLVVNKIDSARTINGLVRLNIEPVWPETSIS